MKIQRLKKSLFCAFIGGGLFVTAHRLVGAPDTTGSLAEMAGLAIYLSGSWALAAAFYTRWLNVPEEKAEIDVYTAALVEVELAHQKEPPPEPTAPSGRGSL